jgi:hypothetical protein
MKRGTSLSHLAAEAVRRLLAAESAANHRRMTCAPIKLPPGRSIAVSSLNELEQLARQSDFE